MDSRVVVEFVPWYDRQQFEEVYTGLYSTNVFNQRKAVEMVEDWEVHSQPCLPMGIDSTAALVRANIQEKVYNLDPATPCQSPEIRLLYCSALIRFVNVLSEMASKNDHSTPLRVSAAKVGIPEWLVHLRNNASHSRLPHIEMLCNGAKCALAWLQENYWKKELCSFVDFISPRRVLKNKIDDLICRYQSCQFEIMSADITAVQRRMREKDRKHCLSDMKRYMTKDCKTFFKLLVRPGLFLPTSFDLAAILLRSGENLFIEEKTIDLPKSLFLFWMPLIEVIIYVNCLTEFLEFLFQSQKNKNSLHQKVAAAWAFKLINIDQDPEKSELSKVYNAKRPSLNWVRLLASCARYACEYSPHLLIQFANNVYPPLSEERKSQLMGLSAVYMGAVADTPASDAKCNLKARNLEKDVIDLQNKKSKVWRLIADGTIEWSIGPLGAVLGSRNSRQNLSDEIDAVQDDPIAENDPTSENADDKMTALGEYDGETVETPKEEGMETDSEPPSWDPKCTVLYSAIHPFT